MGSQSVTNFTTAKMNRIRNLVKDYSPRSSGAGAKAMEIGAAAVGALRATPTQTPASTAKEKGKGSKGGGGAGLRKVTTTQPTSGFEKALNSLSVEAGLNLILTAIEQLKEDPEKVYEQSRADARHPVIGISAFLKKAHSGILNKAQKQTESAFAANEAIPKTIIEIISRARPGEKEAIEIDRKSLSQVLKTIPEDTIVNVYLENVAAALIDLVLDASRGKIPPGEVDKIKKSVREHFVPELIARIKRKRKPKREPKRKPKRERKKH